MPLSYHIFFQIFTRSKIMFDSREEARMSRNLKTCPYDMTHQIRPERMHYHLIKCMKNHPEVSMKICPYNGTHHLPASDIRSHLQECPDRRIVEIQRFKLNDPIPGKHGDLSNPVVFGSSLISQESEAENKEGDQTVEQSLDITSASMFGLGDVPNVERRGPVQRPEAVIRRRTIEKIMERKDEEEEEVILSGNLGNITTVSTLSPIPESMLTSESNLYKGAPRSEVSGCSGTSQLRRPKNVNMLM